MAEYIEREAAIDRLEKLFQLQAATARAIIEAIPAADVAPVRHGRWIDPAAENCYRCSICEEYTTLEMPRLFYHYCPNCGAKMDKEEDK